MRLPPDASYRKVLTLSSFRRRVYHAVACIPKGSVRTYGQIAKAVGIPRAARAVGTALALNRYRDVPCHRVVRADGTLGEYAFGGTKAKARRLDREGVKLVHGRAVFPK